MLHIISEIRVKEKHGPCKKLRHKNVSIPHQKCSVSDLKTKKHLLQHILILPILTI